MNGLECSEIKLSMLDTSGRIDPEFYKKRYLLEADLIRHSNYKMLSAIADFIVGPFGSAYDTNNYVENPGFRYIRGQDVQPFVLSYSSPRYISEKDYKRLSRYALNQDDILVSVVGTIGNACIITKEDVPAIFSCKSTAIRAKTINPYFLVTFLNSKYGYDLLSRRERGAVQKGINLEDLKSITVPTFSDKFQSMIEKALKISGKLLTNSRNLMAMAQQVLNCGISLPSEYLPANNISIKSFSESFGKTGRLDAEYYQSKHYELMSMLNSGNTIGNSCRLLDTNFNPDDNSEYKYIELANIGMTGEISGVVSIPGDSLPTRARRLVHTGNVIVPSIEGSLGSCAIITEEYDNALCSTGFYVLDSHKYNSETLFVLLKSDPIQTLLKRGCSGTILTSISKDEFLDIPLPAISNGDQNRLKEMVSKVYTLRRRSNFLLDAAGQAVETAIEKGEEKAISWLHGAIDPAVGEVPS